MQLGIQLFILLTHNLFLLLVREAPSSTWRKFYSSGPFFSDSNIAQFLLALEIPSPNPPTPKPSPVSAHLRQQIIASKFIDLAELILPPLNQPAPPRLIGSHDGHHRWFGQKRSLLLSSVFSLNRDVFCTAFPSRRQELKTYLTIVLNFALRFGGTSFYQYHIQFSSQAAACLHSLIRSHCGAVSTRNSTATSLLPVLHSPASYTALRHILLPPVSFQPKIFHSP